MHSVLRKALINIADRVLYLNWDEFLRKSGMIRSWSRRTKSRADKKIDFEITF